MFYPRTKEKQKFMVNVRICDEKSQIKDRWKNNNNILQN
jgi:hypothetical protein